jgi:4-amino-4-deoxy-L-arabinose transferase-like glycosyltransferase
MHLNGAPWFVQPPLYFWVAALFAKVFGVTEFALRLPSALATIAIVAGIGYGMARVRGGRAAILSSLVASTMLINVIVGRLAIMDAMLDAAIAASIGGVFAALRGASIAWWYLAWAAAGLGILTKGPVAAVVPLLVLVPWAWWESRSTPLAIPARIHWVAATVVLLAIVLPWTVALAASAGVPALTEMLGHYTFGRYVGTIENQAGPVWYYVPVLVLGAFPWFAFLPPAVLGAWKAARLPGGHLERLALLWIAVPFVFFSFAQTKLPNYVALEFPALAILVGMWFDTLPSAQRRGPAIAWALLVPLSLAVLSVAIVLFSRDNRLSSDLASLRSIFAVLGAIVFVGWAVMLALLARRATSAYAPVPLAAAGILAFAIIAIVALPLADSFKPIPPLAAVIRAQHRDGDVVAIQGVRGGNALLFYTRPRVLSLAQPSEAAPDAVSDPRQSICGARRAFVVTSAVRPVPDPTYGRSRRELARAQNDVLYLYDGPRCL